MRDKQLRQEWLFQIKQLVQIVEKSDAGFIILGGDFNFDPYVNNYRPQNDSESTLEDIQKVMVNSMEDFLKTKEVSSWCKKAK